MIAQSLICFWEVLEVKRAKTFGVFEERFHQQCVPELSLCFAKATESLTSSMGVYIEKLSLVFFKKQNLRDNTWWLSVIYSLTIQSMVRQILRQTLYSASTEQHLYLAVRLFIASSGEHDPLMDKWVRPSSPPPEEITHYEAAKLSLRTSQWSSNGLESSRDFLRHIFEDDGTDIPIRAAREERAISPQLPTKHSFSDF